MLCESQKLSTYYIAFWTSFVFGHPLCAGSASVTIDDPVLVACVKEIDGYREGGTHGNLTQTQLQRGELGPEKGLNEARCPMLGLPLGAILWDGLF